MLDKIPGFLLPSVDELLSMPYRLVLSPRSILIVTRSRVLFVFTVGF